MAIEQGDPRDTPLHPRFCEGVVGHQAVVAQFKLAIEQGRPHHAWLLSGKSGIGKATLAYWLARLLLSQRTKSALQDIDLKVTNLVLARSHPDLFVLQRQMGEGKAAKLKTEISVENARQLGEFFSQTAAMAQWRVAIIDTVDELNLESANALLKLVEEPPANCVIFLVCNRPGRVLRTIKSRCLHVEMPALSGKEIAEVLSQQRFQDLSGDIPLAVSHAAGSAGRALALLSSAAAKAIALLSSTSIATPESRSAIANAFGGRAPSTEDFEIFIEMLMSWIAGQAQSGAAARNAAALADAYGEVQQLAAKTLGLNLDRKMAILQSLVTADRALKAA